jgi:nitrite reductase/ring-hydroxylating ferredoxin subunit
MICNTTCPKPTTSYADLYCRDYEMIPPGSRKLVDVAGRSIGIFNIQANLYAIRNSCPHQGDRSVLPADRLFDRRSTGRYHQPPWEILRAVARWEYDVKLANPV